MTSLAVETAPAPPPNPLKETVEANVLKALGRPKKLHSVVAINLYQNRWRVNVRCFKEDNGVVPTVSITDSFFLHTDAQGNIKDEIAKKY